MEEESVALVAFLPIMLVSVVAAAAVAVVLPPPTATVPRREGDGNLPAEVAADDDEDLAMVTTLLYLSVSRTITDSIQLLASFEFDLRFHYNYRVSYGSITIMVRRRRELQADILTGSGQKPHPTR